MELVCLCRAGFEKEVASELNGLSASFAVVGYVKAKSDTGVVQYVSEDIDGLIKMITQVDFWDLIFIRHWFISAGPTENLGSDDRVSPLLQHIEALCELLPYMPCELEGITFDTNEGKSLTALTKSICSHLRSRIKKSTLFAQSMSKKSEDVWIAQLVFIDGQHAYIGAYPKSNVSRWQAGIPRLKVPRAAPSRATLKLEEAWHHFVPREEWETRLAPGMRSVDLGAAPGGWTWQLVQKSMFVDAVDNGPMNESLMESGQVTHHRVDGFRYSPQKALDWLVCDIADKPSRVASLISRWAKNRWFTEAVFNLKLPMKQRYLAVEEARQQISGELVEQGIPHTLRFKQLYHDREEVTAHLRLH